MNRVIVMLGLLISVACGEPPPEELKQQPLGRLPAWEFVDSANRPIGTQKLAGKPYAVNFLFTSCPSACPPLAKASAKLQAMMLKWRESGGARIVSITVDPMTDTPEVLRTFGRKYGAKPWIWSFARGDYEAMEALVVKGFYQPLLRRDRRPGAPVESVAHAPTPLDTAHGVRFVLVDGQGRMRALYEKDDQSLARLDHALRWLSAHPGK